MIIVQFIIHYSLHLLLPVAVAKKWFADYCLKATLILWSTMIIDIDHLWANPVFDSCRCSVGFHTFHTWPFVMVYILLCFYPKTRLIGLGLTMHILTDLIDCQLSSIHC